MDHTTMLTNLLKLHFGWHLARVKCLSYLLIALVKVKTVNFTELATAFPATAAIDSHYKRIQRFFKQVHIHPTLTAHFVVSFLPYETYTLSLDRTNWMFGGFAINFLVLSVVHQGIAFPLFWSFLPKQGTSNTQERIHLLEDFLHVFGTHRIDCLLADREFLGEKWFAYLIKHHIRFRLRIKSNMLLSRTGGTLAPASNFFRSLPVSTYCTLSGPRFVCGHWLWITGMRLPSGEYLIVVANDHTAYVLEDYQKRWKIEVLFQALKSRGFNFEDTHVHDEIRLKRLFAVLAMAFCWAYHIGAWLHVLQPIGIKKHQRPARSIFRYGFDWIRHHLFNSHECNEQLTDIMLQLWHVLTGGKPYIYQL